MAHHTHRSVFYASLVHRDGSNGRRMMLVPDLDSKSARQPGQKHLDMATLPSPPHTDLLYLRPR